MKINVIASGSSGNCYRISDGTTSLLIEAGIPIKKIKEGCDFKLSEISGCLISHSHQDHSKAARAVMSAGIELYCSVDTAAELTLEGYRLHIIKPLERFTIGTFEIIPFPVHHDVMSFGYLIKSVETREKLLFVTDTYYVDYVFKGITHMMVEANYSTDALNEAVEDGQTATEIKRRLYQSHMDIENTVALLKANNMQNTIKQVYLLHLSANNASATDFKKRVQAATGAEVYIT